MLTGVNLSQILMLIIGTILILAWFFLYIKYNKKFDEMIKPIAKNEFFMSEIFFIGFGIMELTDYRLKSSRAKKNIKKISELKGELYAQYNYYKIVGAKFTYIATMLPIAFFIGALVNDFMIFMLFLITIAVLIYYLDFEVDNALSKRKSDIQNDFPRALSKLALLLNAGQSLRNAWNNVANSNSGILYEEMKIFIEEVSNGKSEIEAYKSFGERCNIKEVKKFSSILIQNIQKGNKEITDLILEISKDSWEQKKYNVKIKAELASSKLMIPVGMMLLAIMIMIIVPIFSSL
jgi:tight adherence protein C